MRLLIGPRHHGQIVEREIFPGVREAFLSPRFENDVERFLEAIAALVIPNAVARIGAGKAAAADAEVETALADLIDGGGLFGGADGVTERQDADPGADPQACRAGCDSGHSETRSVGEGGRAPVTPNPS